MLSGSQLIAELPSSKLSLLNFLSLSRDLQKPTVVAEFFRVLREPTTFVGGGGVLVGIFRFTPH